MILEANPDYRTVQFPESGDPVHAKVVASMRGLALPRIGVIEIGFIEESTTRVLEFERGMLDYALLSGQAANRLIADGTLKPAYAAAGIVHY